MKHIIYLLLIILISNLFSCVGNSQCTQNKYVMLGVGLYHVSYNDITKTYTTSTLTIDSLTVQGIKRDTITGKEFLVDSLIYNNKKSISKIFLPLNKSKSANESKFAVKFNNTIDTVTIFHTNYDDYLSLECGCIKTHSIDTVSTTNHFIDSVRIVIHNVNTTNAEHIHIYN